MKGKSKSVFYGVIALAVVVVIGCLLYFKTGANQQASVGVLKDSLIASNSELKERVWRKLCRDGFPHVQVLSPNGGETYTPGQRITVNWRSCNVQNFPGGSTSAVGISLKQQSSGARYTLIPNTNPQYGYGNFTQNDGSETVVLPTVSTYPATPISYGTDFRVTVALTNPYPPIEAPDRNPIFDESDNLFTINKPIILPTVQTGEVANITSNSAVVSGVVNMNNSCSGHAYFQYGQVGGNMINSQITSLNSSFNANVNQMITNLSAGIKYQYRIVADNCNGDVGGNWKYFTTTSMGGTTTTTGTTNPTTGTTIDPWIAICSDGKPNIQVLSPNGGERYAAGDSMMVTWKSCNIPTDSSVGIYIHSSKYTGGGISNLITTLNDGIEKIKVPTVGVDNAPLASGNYYKINISSGRTNDFSNNTFTISNSAQ